MLTRGKCLFQNHNPFTIVIGDRLAKQNVTFKNGDHRTRHRLPRKHRLPVGFHLGQING